MVGTQNRNRQASQGASDWIGEEASGGGNPVRRGPGQGRGHGGVGESSPPRQQPPRRQYSDRSGSDRPPQARQGDFNNSNRSGRDGGGGRSAPKREALQTIAFDSVGPRKYALQVQKAYNGNPCLRIVTGYPRDDGTYGKFDITIWSEDFEAFFSAMDEVRQFIDANDIRTPEGHNWQPKRRRE